jgi:mannitol-1-/sugar-/sorbitol-6-phosphatase
VLSRIVAVLFDMDGTLVDSDGAVARAWAWWGALRRISAAEIARVTPGRPASESVALLAPWLDRAQQRADAEALLARERADLGDIVATPGALALLSALDSWGLPHAVVTSAVEGLARARLAAAGIAIPQALVTADMVRRGKPDPEGYLLAATRLGIPADRCLVVEDTLAGVRAGLAAGATVAAVRPIAEAYMAAADLHQVRRLLSAHRGTEPGSRGQGHPKCIPESGRPLIP